MEINTSPTKGQILTTDELGNVRWENLTNIANNEKLMCVIRNSDNAQFTNYIGNSVSNVGNSRRRIKIPFNKIQFNNNSNDILINNSNISISEKRSL